MYFFLSISGHVDPGETEIQAAIRETEEEAGLKQDQYTVMEGFKRTLRYQAFKKPKRVEYWLAELNDPQTEVKLSHEHRDFKWLGLEEAVTYAQFPDMQGVYREAHQFIQSHS